MLTEDQKQREMLVRMECLKLANAWPENHIISDILKNADRMADFVLEGKTLEGGSSPVTNGQPTMVTSGDTDIKIDVKES